MKRKYNEWSDRSEIEISGALTPLLVSKQQAANLLGLCLRTVTTLVATKELTCRKVGKRTLIPYRELIRFASRDHAGHKAEAQ